MERSLEPVRESMDHTNMSMVDVSALLLPRVIPRGSPIVLVGDIDAPGL